MVNSTRTGLNRKPLELRKAMDILQHEIAHIGVTLIVPRTLRLRLRGDEPEQFSPPSAVENHKDGRVAERMANCKDWDYLDRVL